MDQAAIRSRTGSSSSRETGSLSSAKLRLDAAGDPGRHGHRCRGQVYLARPHRRALPDLASPGCATQRWAAHAIGRVLRAGVTSIAVPGGKWFTDVSVRGAVEGGLREGPRMVVAGRALSNYGGIFDPDPYPAFEGIPADTAGVLCNTRDEFIRETRRQCKRGVDLIKIANSTWGDVQTVADDEIAAVAVAVPSLQDFQAGPRVRRFFAGGKWIRTPSSAPSSCRP